MAYFFQRFSREHPNVIIKMASYGRNSVFKQAVKARGGKVIASDDAVADKAVIWLLDGTPTTIPGGDVHWVSFTTPDESWMKKLAKNTSSCAEVFMPVWTLKELCEAAIMLDRSDLMEQSVTMNCAFLGSTQAMWTLQYQDRRYWTIALRCLAASRGGASQKPATGLWIPSDGCAVSFVGCHWTTSVMAGLQTC
jgi:hypothetical protein